VITAHEADNQEVCTFLSIIDFFQRGNLDDPNRSSGMQSYKIAAFFGRIADGTGGTR
jgi:hypothetical protein